MESHNSVIHLITAPATVIIPPLDGIVTEGSTVTLQCSATGKPNTITYTWKHASNDIIIGGRYSLNGGSLTISNIIRDDDGIYTCYASNGVGQPDSASATVTVYCKYCCMCSVLRGI